MFIHHDFSWTEDLKEGELLLIAMASNLRAMASSFTRIPFCERIVVILSITILDTRNPRRKQNYHYYYMTVRLRVLCWFLVVD